ncbi:MAG: hypothetical protein VXW22_09260 [Pseudomonadota bacterium]|nr:hypothetical protein [Pseudomonadota bacterium]
MTLEWYQAFNQMLLALGGRGSDRVVRSPEANGTAIPQPVAAATQTIPLTVDGVEYNFLAQ